MKPARHPAVVLLLLAATGISLGCEALGLATQVASLTAPYALPPPPQAPQAPQLPQAPQAPSLSSPVPEPPGNCCFRSGENLDRLCQGRDRCCTGKVGRSECEAGQGLWFHTAEGCTGAC